MSGRGHQDIHAADVEWRPGSGPGTSYARFRMDDADPGSPSIVLSKFAAGSTVPPHTHDSNYFEYIIAGEQTVGKVTFGAGDIRIVKGGTGYGPITIGPDGCTVIIMFEDGSRSNMETLPRKRAMAPAG